MIEKRKKQISFNQIDSSSDNGIEDVEEYDNRKKHNNRCKYSYMLLIIVGLLFIYHYCLTHADEVHSYKSFDNELSNPLTSTSSNSSSNSFINHRIIDIKHKAEIATDSMVSAAKARGKLGSSNSSVTDAHTRSLSELQAQVDAQVALVRNMKFEKKIVMETDSQAKIEIKKLQQLLQKLLPLLYGPTPYVVEMKILFPNSMADPQLPQEQTLLIELAPIDLVPYSVYFFLNVVKNWKSGQFHRNAGHVLQAWVKLIQPGSSRVPLAFQEYHPGFPHRQYTLGYAGRPGGPEFYISTLDNSANHGPGSQGTEYEADGCFGKLRPESIPIVKRMQKQPGRGNNGFIKDEKDNIVIQSLRLLTP